MKGAGKLILAGMLLNLGSAAIVSREGPEILRIAPTSGPEGTRVEINGQNLLEATAILFGGTESDFKPFSSEKLLALVPHRAVTGPILVRTRYGQASSPFPFAVVNDPRVPEEVSYKAGYVNSDPIPADFSSAMLWGIAIADTRAPGYEAATVEIAWTQLSCRVDDEDVVMNEDRGKIRGGLFRRIPWFSTNQNEPMPLAYDEANHAAVLHVGQRVDRAWHFWSASPRVSLPKGKLEGCTAKARVRITPGALLQMGFDYWRDPIIAYGSGGNNHEAGASNWYFSSERWQEAVFTDIRGPQF